mgnify:CR=1 FL=1
MPPVPSRQIHLDFHTSPAIEGIGEAFDKAAKMLGLGFPGGPEIARCAADGNPDADLYADQLLAENSLKGTGEVVQRLANTFY